MVDSDAHIVNAPGSQRRGWLFAMLIVILAATVLRWGTDIRATPLVFDEKYITIPIIDLIERGWSVETAIDFTETKGPAMIWTYAFFGELLGGEINDLRFLSMAFFVGAIVPLVLIARRLGLTSKQIAAVSVLYVLLPMNAVLGQMVMSESSFIFGCAWLSWIFLWGFRDNATNERRVLGPLLFGALLAILLHHRVHAVAFAGAAALISFERDRWRSWPWWIACIIAGVLRVPLWIRWGGLVAPDYQFSHTLGISLNNLTYLAAAMLPYTGVFLLAWIVRPDWRRDHWKIVAIGAFIGLLLGIIAPPLASHTIVWGDRDLFRFQGIVAAALGKLSPRLGGDPAYLALIAMASTVGVASLAALAARAWRFGVSNPYGQVHRMLVWTLFVGWGMYIATDGQVFDRYILPWAILAPITWLLLLPRPLLWLQIVQLMFVSLWFVVTKLY
ncbi:MAG: hypothetical protein AAF432_07215 [Planctomycetota bacterium]